jgi:hypothetical protein
MSTLTTFVQQAVSHTRRSFALSARAGRRSLALGAVLLIGSTVTVLATANMPPHITGITLTPNVGMIDEGQSVTVNVTWTDPDPNDMHTVYFDWYKGSLGKFQVPAGTSSFQTTLTFNDDSYDKVSIPSVFVRVADRQFPVGQPNDNREAKSQDSSQFPLKVNNVAPTFAHAPQPVKLRNEPGKVTIQGDITDPGADDTEQVFVIWDTSMPHIGDGQPCTVNKRHFTCEHTYPVSKPVVAKTYNLKLTVRDDDGGQNVANTSVQIP